MFVRKSTHEAEVKKLKAEIARTGVSLTNAEELNRKYATAISRTERERDEALAKLKPFLDRQAKATKNLRQFQAPSGNAVAGAEA